MVGERQGKYGEKLKEGCRWRLSTKRTRQKSSRDSTKLGNLQLLLLLLPRLLTILTMVALCTSSVSYPLFQVLQSTFFFFSSYLHVCRRHLIYGQFCCFSYTLVCVCVCVYKYRKVAFILISLFGIEHFSLVHGRLV